MTGGFIDKGRSEGRISGESECAAAHRGVVGGDRKRKKGGCGVLYVILRAEAGALYTQCHRWDAQSSQARALGVYVKPTLSLSGAGTARPKPENASSEFVS
jgi:hypothetical protein